MRLIGEPDLLCIDWDERLLRVVNAGFSHGAPYVRNAFAAAVPPGLDVRDPQSMGAFIRKTLSEHRVRTRRAIVDIPRQDAVLTLLNLPRGTTDEMAAMVHMQVGREMPFARDQAVIDFAVGRMEEGSPGCEVWAAAVRTSLIDHLEQTVAAAGLKVDRIGLRSYGNLVAVRAAGELPTRTVTVDVGPSMTEINVIRDGRLVFSRAASVSIPAGGIMAQPPPPPATAGLGDGAIPFGDDAIARPRALDSLLVEVSRTIEAYRATDPGARVDRIILAGSGGITPAVASAFENRFGVSTGLFEPPESMRWDSADAVSAAPFSAAIGLALSGSADSLLHFNFIHPKEPEGEHRERAKRRPVMVIAALVVAALGAYLAYLPISSRNKQAELLRKQLNTANADLKQREELGKQITDARNWHAKNVIWLDTMHEIATRVYTSNKDAYLTRMIMSESGLITLEMAAADNKVVGDMVKNAQKIVVSDKAKKTEVPVYDPKPGDWDDSLSDPKYPVKDEMFLQIRSLVARPRR